MLTEERHAIILDTINRQHSVRLNELCELLGTSESTIRRDLTALDEKYGKNKYVWDNSVDNYILLKSNEEYFNDPVCKNGYFRGVETYNFVKEVMSRGEVYKKKIKD